MNSDFDINKSYCSSSSEDILFGSDTDDDDNDNDDDDDSDHSVGTAGYDEISVQDIKESVSVSSKGAVQQKITKYFA